MALATHLGERRRGVQERVDELLAGEVQRSSPAP